MKQVQLNRYCDEVLKVLYRHANEDPLLFGIGEFRKDQRIANDLFVKIDLSEEDTKTVIHTLEGGYRYIETITKERSNYYDLGMKEHVASAVFSIKLTDAGRYFVQTSSFAREERWRTINRWIPDMPNIIAISAIIISIFTCAICIVDNRAIRAEMARQKEALQKEIKAAQNKAMYGPEDGTGHVHYPTIK